MMFLIFSMQFPYTLAKVLTEKTFFTIMSRLLFSDHFLYYSHLFLKLLMLVTLTGLSDKRVANRSATADK